MKIFSLLFLLIIFSELLNAQEVLLRLTKNPILQNKEDFFKSKEKSGPITLPFIEDFSSHFVYPDQNVFTDSLVFISGSFAYNPFSIGVATFDGFDQNGNFYEHGSSFQFPADSLSSTTIRLDSILSGSPHITSIADSLYFSFYFQAQGLGEKPDSDDSLVLQFYAANQDKWINIWASKGMSLLEFQTLYNADWKCVMIPILDTMFFNDGFRFRFMNYASYADLSFPTWASNADFWNIDYIYIDSDRDMNDSLPEDLCFKERKETLLKNHYNMPWNQFLANTSGEMSSNIDVPYSNYSASLINATERLIITDLSGTTTTYNSGLSAANIPAYTDTSFYRSPVPYTFNSLVTNNAEFLVQLCINTATISDMIASNDTLAFYQRFYNYFASDDGIPEAGYGLSVDGALLAYAFTLNIPDTLQSIQMYFNKTLDNANEIYFYLTIWDDNSGAPGNIIYQQQGVLPQFDTGFYNYHNYLLENPLPVSGTFYIGWEQTSDEVLNIGFDMNSDRSDRIFFNTDGNWYNTLYEGALMIRPVLGSTAEVFLDIEEHQNDIIIYPNPCNHCGIISIQGLTETPEIISIYNLNGRLLLQEINSISIKTNELSAGFYLMKIDFFEQESIIKKVLITP